MHITPEICRAAYDYLIVTLPFRRWQLPKVTEVEFQVVGNKAYMGACFQDKPIIRISQPRITTTQCLIETMAHEMCHMRQHLIGQKTDSLNHGKKWKKLAEQVCRYHGFNKDYF